MKKTVKKNKLNLLLLILFAITILATGCGEKNNVKVYETEEMQLEVKHEEKTVTAIVDRIDLSTNEIDFVECASGRVNNLVYHGGVNVTNAYGNAIDIDTVVCGDVVEVTYYADTLKICAIALSAKATKRQNISKFTINTEKNKAYYKGTECSVADCIRAYDNGKNIDIKEISTEDQVTLNFCGDKLVSVVVELGHGYVRLRNQDTYIGGMVEIGYDVIVPVTNDMLLEVREGTYNLRLSKNGIINNKDAVVVKKGKETEVDLIDVAIPRGTVIFNITPVESTLYINNVAQNEHAYSNLYGSYTVKISADGYKSFIGKIEIANSVKSYDIELTKLSSDDDEDDTSEDTTTETTTQATTETPSTTEKVATANTITVDSPTDVSVYFDGDYMGMSPVTFNKTVGTHTITLYKSGYLIKSYTIQSLDDGNNDTYSLADLVPISDGSEVIE